MLVSVVDSFVAVFDSDMLPFVSGTIPNWNDCVEGDNLNSLVVMLLPAAMSGIIKVFGLDLGYERLNRPTNLSVVVLPIDDVMVVPLNRLML